MSTRAIKAEIAQRKLDPRVAYSKVDRNGFLIDPQARKTVHETVVQQAFESPTVNVEVEVEVEVEEKEVRNALVDLGVQEETLLNETTSADVDSNQSKKNNRFKKKIFSTDP